MRQLVIATIFVATVMVAGHVVAQPDDTHQLNYLRWKATQQTLPPEEALALEEAEIRGSMEQEQYVSHQHQAEQLARRLEVADAEEGIPLAGHWTDSGNVHYWFFEDTFIAEKRIPVSQSGAGRRGYLPLALGAGTYSTQGDYLVLSDGSGENSSVVFRLARQRNGERTLHLAFENGERIQLNASAEPAFNVTPRTNTGYAKQEMLPNPVRETMNELAANSTLQSSKD
ncbi:MAG: hypothetical protein AAF456_23080 [Planctomycetota bacterium]